MALRSSCSGSPGERQEVSQGKASPLRTGAGFTCGRVRVMIGRPRPLPGDPTAPALYPISVRPLRTLASGLLPTSASRRRSCLRLAIPSPGLAEDLHLLHQRHAWHTKLAKKAGGSARTFAGCYHNAAAGHYGSGISFSTWIAGARRAAGRASRHCPALRECGNDDWAPMESPRVPRTLGENCGAGERSGTPPGRQSCTPMIIAENKGARRDRRNENDETTP
jgi:hypothetical protein